MLVNYLTRSICYPVSVVLPQGLNNSVSKLKITAELLYNMKRYVYNTYIVYRTISFSFRCSYTIQ